MRIVREVALMEGDQRVALPVGARPLWVGVVDGAPVMSVLVDPEATLVEKTVRVLRSGVEFDEKSFACDHIGSYAQGGVVYHVLLLV